MQEGSLFGKGGGRAGGSPRFFPAQGTPAERTYLPAEGEEGAEGFSTMVGLDSIWKGPKSISAISVRGYWAFLGTLTESAQVKPHP